MTLFCIFEFFSWLIFFLGGSFEISGFFESVKIDLELGYNMIWGIGIFQESIFMKLNLFIL